MLRLLEVGEGHRVLDVGAGSGWTTALLEHLVGPSGEVHGVERVPELVATGSANLAAAGCRATIHPATEGVLGLPELAPFDRILVSAEPEELPEELVAQMNDELDGGPDGGARMVIPVRGTMLLVVRRGREAAVTEHGAYRFVPLLRD
jgi:protein-L-isoaspartate(D-aspartate) O-methyltransferase